MFKKIFSVMLAMMMCAFALAACGSKEDDEDSIYASQKQRSELNSSAKTLYTIANSLCEKSETSGIRFATDAKTGILVIEAGGDGATVGNLVSSYVSGNIPDENLAELQKAVNAQVSEKSDGYFYIIEFSEKGWPKAAYISEKEDESFVGRYPEAMDNDDEGAYSLKSFAD